MPTINEDLITATEEGNKEEVIRLLKAGADINARRKKNAATPLLIAAHRGHVEVVTLLLDAGADVNAHARYGDFLPHVEKIYMKGGMDKGMAGSCAIIRAGSTALHEAMRGIHPMLTKAVKAAGVKVDHKVDHLGVVKALLAGGANPNIKDSGGTYDQHHNTPCHYAYVNIFPAMRERLMSFENAIDYIETLLQYGATMPDYYIPSARHLPWGLSKVLVKAGANPGLGCHNQEARIQVREHQWRRHLQAIRSLLIRSGGVILSHGFPENFKGRFIERLESKFGKYSKSRDPSVFYEPAKVLESLNQLQIYINAHTGRKERKDAAKEIQQKLLGLFTSRESFSSSNILEEVISMLSDESYNEVFKKSNTTSVISFLHLDENREPTYTDLQERLVDISKMFNPHSGNINFKELRQTREPRRAPAKLARAAEPEPAAARTAKSAVKAARVRPAAQAGSKQTVVVRGSMFTMPQQRGVSFLDLVSGAKLATFVEIPRNKKSKSERTKHRMVRKEEEAKAKRERRAEARPERRAEARPERRAEGDIVYYGATCSMQ